MALRWLMREWISLSGAESGWDGGRGGEGSSANEVQRMIGRLLQCVQGTG